MSALGDGKRDEMIDKKVVRTYLTSADRAVARHD